MSLVNCEVLVEPQVLYDKATDMEALVTDLRNRLELIGQTVKSTEVNWKGEAGDLYRQMFFIHKGLMDEIVTRLGEHPKDLMEISGVYSQNEEMNVQIAESLPSDAIV